MVRRTWKHHVKSCVKSLVAAVVRGGADEEVVGVGVQPGSGRSDDGIFFVEGDRDKRLVGEQVRGILAVFGRGFGECTRGFGPKNSLVVVCGAT